MKTCVFSVRVSITDLAMLLAFWHEQHMATSENEKLGPGWALRKSLETFLQILRKQGKLQREVRTSEEAQLLFKELGITLGARNSINLVSAVAEELCAVELEPAAVIETDDIATAQALLAEKMKGV